MSLIRITALSYHEIDVFKLLHVLLKLSCLLQICIRYSTIETTEVVHIGNSRFLFPHEYSGEGRGYIQYGQILLFQ
jgi:hypothetical protein